MRYDVGNIIENLIFTWANADAYGDEIHKTTIEDEAKKFRAERIVMSAEKRFILERESLESGKNFLNIIKEVESQF